MAELTTIARPYATALFRLAQESNTLAVWAETLATLKAIASNAEMQAVIANPQLPTGKAQDLVLEFLGEEKRPELVNFIAAILANRRFVVLPAISQMFDELKSASEGRIEALVESAFVLTDAQLADLTAVLSDQFKRKVNAEVSVNSALIGGVKVTLGDLVVDASVRGKLSALAASLKS